MEFHFYIYHLKILDNDVENNILFLEVYLQQYLLQQVSVLYQDQVLKPHLIKLLYKDEMEIYKHF